MRLPDFNTSLDLVSITTMFAFLPVIKNGKGDLNFCFALFQFTDLQIYMDVGRSSILKGVEV